MRPYGGGTRVYERIAWLAWPGLRLLCERECPGREVVIRAE